MVTLNKKIKDFRKNQGLTQHQMAKRLGISQPAYQKIEAGDTDSMRVKTLRNLCVEFNLSADDLLGLGEYKQKTTQIINIFSKNSAAISNDNNK